LPAKNDSGNQDCVELAAVIAGKRAPTGVMPAMEFVEAGSLANLIVRLVCYLCP
jgi:hypothetical protein